MTKEEALKKIKELEEFINQSEDLFNFNTYEKVCKKLKEKQLTEKDYSFLPENRRKKALAQGRIQQLESLFNSSWKVKFDGNQKNWYPYFTAGIGGLVFSGSYYYSSIFLGHAGYFKDQETSNFIGNNFKEIYRDLY